ncbi:rhodanese-like domain-containing protein [Sulfuriferula thiophila]|uniref:rhodanese-like domain-containing protein n=1 Tax=Sulfuriferula thiophila TaxID=1781211 RepID=UPI000F6158D9|nr:rhodanese-like domain-containing protein [Sulfuriferula thiophila]
MLQISPHELSGLLVRQPDAVIIDVRFQHERDEIGYVYGSYHIPLYTPEWDPNPDFSAAVAEVAGVDTPVIFICRTGNRSCEACNIVQAQGYHHIYNLREGYVGLVNLMPQTTSDDVCQLIRLPDQIGDIMGLCA